jgi:hypothetical protein
LAYHLDRKRRAEEMSEEELQEASNVDTSKVEEALKQALSL